MVTKIRQSARPWAYLKEHRKAVGLTALQMAGRLDVERESVYRYERYPLNMSLNRLQQWAEACGLESYIELFRRPEQKSVDAILDGLPDDVQEIVIDMATRLAARAK
jgi:transcriptional regulator with XRE-family HTH domain